MEKEPKGPRADLQVLPNSRSHEKGISPTLVMTSNETMYRAVFLSGESTRDGPQEPEFETEFFHNERKKWKIERKAERQEIRKKER